MRFKILGLLLLAFAAYLAADSYIDAVKSADTNLPAQVFPLLAIFLVLVVRVLQAEKHHRDAQRAARPKLEEKPAEHPMGHAMESEGAYERMG
jgi:hypothetical protein